MLEANEANEANDVQTSLEARQYCHLGKGNNAPCHPRLEALISNTRYHLDDKHDSQVPGTQRQRAEMKSMKCIINCRIWVWNYSQTATVVCGTRTK